VVVVNKNQLNLNYPNGDYNIPHANANGTFSFTTELKIQKEIEKQQGLEGYLKYDKKGDGSIDYYNQIQPIYDLITNCQISCGL
jgi:hypothetical protein